MQPFAVVLNSPPMQSSGGSPHSLPPLPPLPLLPPLPPLAPLPPLPLEETEPPVPSSDADPEQPHAPLIRRENAKGQAASERLRMRAEVARRVPPSEAPSAGIPRCLGAN